MNWFWTHIQIQTTFKMVFTLKTNVDRLSNSVILPTSVWSSRNSIGFVELNTSDVEASLKISPGTFLWIPNTSTKYFWLSISPARLCLLRFPVQTKAVPRFESIKWQKMLRYKKVYQNNYSSIFTYRYS